MSHSVNVAFQLRDVTDQDGCTIPPLCSCKSPKFWFQLQHLKPVLYQLRAVLFCRGFVVISGSHRSAYLVPKAR